MDILNKHYIRTDTNGYIIKSFSDAFEQPLPTDTFIEEGDRHYNLDLWDNGIPKLKYDISIRPCTQAEIDAYRASLPPQPKSELELLSERVAENQGAIDFIVMNL